MATAKQNVTPEAEEPRKTASAEVREQAQTIARSEKNIATRAEALAVENSEWGKACSPAQRAAVAEIAREMGLSLAAGHIIVLGGKPFITVGGHYTHMRKEGGPDALAEGPLPKEEWDYWDIPAGSWAAWKVTITRGGIAYSEVGWSGPSRDQTTYKSGDSSIPHKFKGEMARKRARARTIEYAFPTGLTSFEEVQSGEEMPDDMYQRVTQTIKQPKRASETPAVPTPEQIAEEEKRAANQALLAEQEQEYEEPAGEELFDTQKAPANHDR